MIFIDYGVFMIIKPPFELFYDRGKNKFPFRYTHSEGISYEAPRSEPPECIPDT
jgi:hypothetical protein